MKCRSVRAYNNRYFNFIVFYFYYILFLCRG
nr:MAG TPA: hypothetical protein [Caudoviricetes sp.]